MGHIRFFTFCAILCAPVTTWAATLTLTTEPAHIGVGDAVRIAVTVDSDAAVNAFSGTLRYPAEYFEVEGVSDGNSIVNAWITRPALAAAGRVAFAGGTAGGFVGRGGTIFSVVLRATHAGEARLSLTDVEVLRNDGAGTPEPTSARPLTLRIASRPNGGFVEEADSNPPEPFDAYLLETEAGRMLAFSALDKGSGVARYEVIETRLPAWLAHMSWEQAESPYRVHDQQLTSDVSIKAIDRAGNARVTVVHRVHWLRPYEWFALCGILMVLAALALALRRRVFL